VPVNEPFIFPYLETRTHAGEHVEAVAGFYSLPIIGTFDVMGSADVVAMVDEMDDVAGHEGASVDAAMAAVRVVSQSVPCHGASMRDRIGCLP